jgi:hypothetical protein
VGRKYDVYKTNVKRWSGEKEKPKGISKKRNMYFIVKVCVSTYGC